MSYSFMGFGMFLFTLPVLIAQWVGILGLGKANRNGAWWCMMSGIGCSTLGTVGSILFMLLMMGGIMGGMAGGMVSVIASGGLTGLGSLLFAIGFAIHGLQASRAQNRIGELEAIATAQSEELHRHRAS